VPGVVLPAAPVDRAVYASLTRRYIAAFIDSLFLSVLGFGSGMLFGGVLRLAQVPKDRAILILTLVGWLLWAVYKVGLQCSEFQATVGKLAVGIKVTDRDGRRLTLLRSIGRFGGELISAASLSVGYVMAGFTRRRQALHDMLAGTLVVRCEVTPETLAAVPEAPRLSVAARTVLVLLGVVWVGLVALVVAMSFSQRYRATQVDQRHGVADPPRSAEQRRQARAQVEQVLSGVDAYKTEIAAQLENGVSFADVSSPEFQVGVSSGLPFVESIDAVRGAILIVFADDAAPGLASHQLALVPVLLRDGHVVWICGYGPRPDRGALPFSDYREYTSVASETLPPNCR
jgi:uncharacterized RDD family membrane protein YckC